MTGFSICRLDCVTRCLVTGRRGPRACGTWARALSLDVGRGYVLCWVRQMALNVTEIWRVPALGYSAAELRHGPRASVTSSTPMLVLRQNDQAAIAIDELVRDVRKTCERLFVAGGDL